MADKIALFFDVGDTLAVPTLTAAKKLDKLIVFPFVPKSSRSSMPPRPGGVGLRLGIISNTDETLVRIRRSCPTRGSSDS